MSLVLVPLGPRPVHSSAREPLLVPRPNLDDDAHRARLRGHSRGRPLRGRGLERRPLEALDAVHRVAKLRADRESGRKGGVLAHARELQKRGVWHLTSRLPCKRRSSAAGRSPTSTRCTNSGRATCSATWTENRFATPGRRAAAAHYMAKYLTKSPPAELAKKVRRAAGRPLVYVAQSLTRETGVTARTLRLIRRAYREATSVETVLWPMSELDREALSRCWLAGNSPRPRVGRSRRAAAGAPRRQPRARPRALGRLAGARGRPLIIKKGHRGGGIGRAACGEGIPWPIPSGGPVALRRNGP